MKEVQAHRNLDRRMTHPVRSNRDNRLRFTLGTLGDYGVKFAQGFSLASFSIQLGNS